MIKPKKRFLLSSYLTILCFVCTVGVIFATIKVVNILILDIKNFPPASGRLIDHDGIRTVLFVFLPVELLLLFFLCRTYEAFGHMKIQEDSILFRHPFRGKRKLLFSEIKYIGIDYGVISGGVKQFWIYFSKVPIPPKYIHNMNRMALSKQTMRIQYRREVFDSLVYYLPKDLSKRLRANYSIIRLYKKE